MKALRSKLRSVRNADAGLGIIEIMVAMMLLAILAVAVLPLIVSGLTNASTNATLATATSIVNGELEQARSRTACADLAAPDSTVTDSGGVTLSVHRTVGACGGNYPAAISVQVDVSRSTGQVLASATTLVYVEGP